MTLGNTAVVRLEPAPQVISGRLPHEDAAAVFRWIALDREALLDHWHGRIDGRGLAERLKPLPEAST